MIALLEHEHGLARAREERGGDQAVMAASDDDHVKHAVSPSVLASSDLVRRYVANASNGSVYGSPVASATGA